MWWRNRKWAPAFAGVTTLARPTAIIATALLVVSCGFQLRGDPALGVKALAVTAAGGSTVAADIRRALRGSSATSLAPTPETAGAHLRLLQEARDKSVFTITGAGRVYEHQLRLIVRYELVRPGQDDPVIPPTEIEARRLITYSEAAPVAKEAEEALLFKDMQVELAGRILRQVAIAQGAR
jgi:LPS-assembly lipoprotein